VEVAAPPGRQAAEIRIPMIRPCLREEKGCQGSARWQAGPDARESGQEICRPGLQAGFRKRFKNGERA
jgi:hypothetical protein